MFSIIITAHNSEKYIQETLDNILNATKNIKKEIIVVDDGSNDNTLFLLKNYRNIKLICQNNMGVSAARNKGLKNISEQSQLITFIDDSDWVSNNFFSESITFFKKYKNIQIAISPITIFENKNEREHFLNYRFNDYKEIVNIFSDYNYIHFHIGGVIFKSELFRFIDKPFDENLSFWEDAKLINNLLLHTQKYGLVHNSRYYYNRDDYNSLSKSSWKDEERYNYHIINNFFSLINESSKIYGKVIKYIQYVVIIHYLQFLLSHNFKFINIDYMLKEQIFLNLSQKLLSYIDIETIDELNIEKRYKYFLYNLKNVRNDNELENIKVYIHKFNFLKRTIIFSFSEESFNLNNDSKVYIKSKKTYKDAKFVKKEKKDMLYFFSDDFSGNFYFLKLSLKELFCKNLFIIKDYKNNKVINIFSNSVFKRVFKRVFNRMKF
ncbi:glycosyltransferase family 2 protein [Staphylococcus nepalensis]|uniref:glycosyltransferase family 2 protein n=1 Tax=Staphylococcus nepalensis TaxID=214473 RepID=UPI0035174E57